MTTKQLLPDYQKYITTMMTSGSFDFELPPELEASEPPEARGLARDEVRLMVSYRSDNHVVHTHFRELGDYLAAGDLLVINTSGTMNAALNATRADGTPVRLHLSTHLPADLWIVEVRSINGTRTQPFFEAQAGETLSLPAEGTVKLLTPYATDRSRPSSAPTRLWIATLHLPEPLLPYLARHGFPIRYGYVSKDWPSSYYQTVYVTEVGSAEMPSAGRAFTPELITRLVAQGVQIAPLLLHTGVSSLESHEPPYEEYYRVPTQTARIVNETRAAGKRVVAIGTTVVRSLETVTDEEGITHPGEGWTRLVITPERGIRSVNAMLTGLHEPRASHLAMLEALARQVPQHANMPLPESLLARVGQEHLKIAYSEALRERYLWHEFGDLHLILP
jgi:S-adenosylmethionine:tRNA ribosyltransferase-isomerase